MKNISFLIVAGLISSASFAQSNVSTTADGTNAPASIATLSPALGVGMRNYNEGKIKGSKNDSNEVGAYISPKFTLTYGGPVLNIAMDTEIEMFSGRGYGDGKTGKQDLNDNSYVQLHPMPVLTLKLADAWNLKSNNDISYKNHSIGSNSVIEIASINTFETKLNDRFSVGFGYRADYVSKFGNIVAPTQTKTEKGTEKAVVVKSVSSNVGDNPTTVIHSAFANASVKLNDVAAYKVYVQAGKKSVSAEQNSTANRYRMNNDLVFSNAIPSTEIALRYRVQWEEPNGAEKATLMNLGRVIVNYELSKAWTVDFLNEFVVQTPYTSGEKAEYSNENYLGLTYKF